ncbi:MAG: ECF transporter S component [Clostridia bacterium]|nr:ECF transporter S component [Clostridia bacterium]
MKTTNKRSMSTETMVFGAVMTALVIVFQLLATYTTFFGPFSTAMALIPIVIGAAICGTWIGGWLGLVFGLVVLFSGGATLFFAFDVPGTIITVITKGICCGLAAGAVYNLLKKVNKYLAVVSAAAVCPIVNTGVFLLGSAVFFMDSADAIAEKLGMNASGFSVFIALAFANFLFELVINLVLSPVIVRLLNIKKRT